jgi:hypothetical protein
VSGPNALNIGATQLLQPQNEKVGNLGELLDDTRHQYFEIRLERLRTATITVQLFQRLSESGLAQDSCKNAGFLTLQLHLDMVVQRLLKGNSIEFALKCQCRHTIDLSVTDLGHRRNSEVDSSLVST